MARASKKISKSRGLATKHHLTNLTKKQIFEFKFIQADAVMEKAALLDFIRWFAVPKKLRRPKTMQEFAAECGVVRETLAAWKNLPGFYDELRTYTFSEIRKFTPEVALGIAQAAIGGNPKAAELFMKLFEGYSEKLKVEDTTPPKPDEKQKAAIAKALNHIGLATIIKRSKALEEADKEDEELDEDESEDEDG